MKNYIFNILLSFMLIVVFTGCKKNFTGLSATANEIFWVTNNGADMPVWVKGNMRSNVMILIVHGGPGDGAYSFSDYETSALREKYGVAFWDQRNAGASSGNSNISKLSLSQMVNDLEAVVKVIKYRYQGVHIFLYAHSFGGLLTSAYLVKDTNQNNINGLIDIDGAHNYPLCNNLSKKMLIDSGSVQIKANKNSMDWQEIVIYCNANDPVNSYLAANQIETYAHKAESLMGVNNSTSTNLFTPEDPSATLSNYLKLYYTNAGDHFTESLQMANYSTQLNRITIPALLLWGKYDFTVPSGVANDAISNLSSSYKKLVFFNQSGHRPMMEEPDAVQREISLFVQQFK
ncbi:MAG: alpha/beta fold hydrolase [Flavisolibacter sp.]